LSTFGFVAFFPLFLCPFLPFLEILLLEFEILL
jgi:hypothetical protein